MNGEIFHVHGYEDSTLLSVLPNLIYKFNTSTIKSPRSYFVDVKTMIPKFIWIGKRLRIDNTVLKKKKVKGLILLDFKLTLKLR